MSKICKYSKYEIILQNKLDRRYILRYVIGYLSISLYYNSQNLYPIL